MKKKNTILRFFAFLIITSLIVTNISGFTYADEDDGFIGGVPTPDMEPDIPDPGFIDPVPEPTPHVHSFGPGQLIQDSTCSQPGVTRYTCTGCNYYEDRSEPLPDASKHVVGLPEVTVQPTCTSAGHSIYRCTICGQVVREEDNPPALEHVSDAGTIVKRPTATEPGKIEYKCVNCGIVLREEAIPIVPKRPVPQATFATDTCTVNNIPENSTVILNGTAVTNAASGSLSLRNMFPQTGDYTIQVVANGTDTSAASDPQSILTHKPAAPSNIQTTPEPASGGTGAIRGVDTSMEYALADSENWFSCTSSSQPASAGIYIVRYKATTTSVASDSVEALVMKDKQNKPATPNAVFEGSTHLLKGLTAGMVYSTNGGDTWTKVSDAAVKLSNDAVNQAIAYKCVKVKNIVAGVESDVQTVPAGRVPQPTGVSTSPATSGYNGSINGVGTDMQYRKDGSDAWIDIGGNTVSGLSKGKYFVRRKAYSHLVESNPIELYVDDKSGGTKEGTPSAQFNGYNMHIDGVYGCRISLDGGRNWTDIIKDSTYVVNEAYVNAANGIVLYRCGNGSTTTDSDRQYITLTKQPTPTGISAVSATPTIPGAIVGTDISMQYKPVNQSAWIDITSNTVPLAAGSYLLRRHGYANALPSDCLSVVIKATADVTPAPITPVDNKPVEKEPKKEEPKKEEPKKNTEIVVENNITTTTEEGVSEPVEIAAPSLSTGEKGWQEIEDTFEAATEPVIIRLNDSTDVPAELFYRAAVTDTPIVLSADSSAVWSVVPSDVDVNAVQKMKSVNLGIKENTQNIPISALASVEDVGKNQYIDREFDIKHEGDFGFKAKLTVKVNNAKEGQYANLYWYNTAADKMEFVDSSLVNGNKEATFTMTHASSYVIVRSDVAMSQDSVKAVEMETVTDDSDSKETVSEKTNSDVSKNTAKKKQTPVVAGLIIVIIALIIALVFVLYLQKKKAEEAKKHHQAHVYTNENIHKK